MEGRFKSPSNKHCGFLVTGYGPQAWERPPRYRIHPRGTPSPETHSLSSHDPGHASRRAVHLVLRGAADSAHPVVLQARLHEVPAGRGTPASSPGRPRRLWAARPGNGVGAGPAFEPQNARLEIAGVPTRKRKLDGAAGPACLQNGGRRFLSQIEHPRGLFLPGEKSILSPG